VGRRLEINNTAIITWTNKKTSCKVIFIIKKDDEEVKPEHIFILSRKHHWNITDNIFGIKENSQAILTVREARAIWELLIEKHDFEHYVKQDESK